MTQQQSITVELIGDREMVMKREFIAPRELVFEAHSDCKHLKQWFGPREFPIDYCDLDFRAGGTWHFCMKGPNGEEAWTLRTFEDIERPIRISHRDAFSDPDRNEHPPVAYETISFEDRGERTLLSIHTRYETPEERDQVIEMGVEQGVADTFEQLDELLAALR